MFIIQLQIYRDKKNIVLIKNLTLFNYNLFKIYLVY